MEFNENCVQCNEPYCYFDGTNVVCPSCGYEYDPSAIVEDENVTKDANGNVLVDGDTVLLIKDLKVKGSSIVIKKGTKVKSIRIVDGDHDIACKIDGQSFNLKSEFLKKA